MCLYGYKNLNLRGGLFAPSRLCSLPCRITGACPAELRGPAPQNCGAPNTFFIFFSRKDAETQRNYGALGMTFRRGGLPWRLGVFARQILFFFSQIRKDLPAVGRPARRGERKEIVVHLFVLVSNLLALASPLSLPSPHSLPSKTLPSSSKNSFQSTCRKDG
jgi:hypothetical protein